MHLQENTFLDLTQGHKKVNAAQYHKHHVTYMYVPAKFEVVMPNGLGGDAFTRKYII